jgi:hypothetical protein
VNGLLVNPTNRNHTALILASSVYYKIFRVFNQASNDRFFKISLAIRTAQAGHTSNYSALLPTCFGMRLFELSSMSPGL